MRGPLTDDEDLKQDYALERARAIAEGRTPRPRRWVEADVYRAERGRFGARTTVPWDRMEVAAAPRLDTPRAARPLVDRAVRHAEGLPLGIARTEILLALRCLSARSVEERLRQFAAAYPGRNTTHAEIAREVGTTREAVTRAIGRLRRAAPGVLALWGLACASPVTVSAPACTITAELRTGERIACDADGVTVERASIAETVKASGGLLGRALRTLLGAP